MEDVPDRRALFALHGADGGGGLGWSSDDSSRVKNAEGRIERQATERQTSRPHGRASGRERPRVELEERMPGDRKATDRPDSEAHGVP